MHYSSSRNYYQLKMADRLHQSRRGAPRNIFPESKKVVPSISSVPILLHFSPVGMILLMWRDHWVMENAEFYHPENNSQV
jgi:hypothetical protein